MGQKLIGTTLNNMDYQLAKQLKDAGFPQEYKKGDWVWNIISRPDLYLVDNHGSNHKCGVGVCSCECEVCYPFANNRFIKNPSLLELIEACGERFNKLWKTKAQWIAFAKARPQLLRAKGKTPEEAVTNLWLELNKK